MRETNPIELWWPLGQLSILALFDHHQQVIDRPSPPHVLTDDQSVRPGP
jgi:hypothetical protein